MTPVVEIVEAPKPEKLPSSQKPPKIPRGSCWFFVLAPPVLEIISGLLPGTKWDPPAMLAAGIFCLGFLGCMSVRYRGRSLVLLGAAYYLGEFIICLAISLFFHAVEIFL